MTSAASDVWNQASWSNVLATGDPRRVSEVLGCSVQQAEAVQLYILAKCVYNLRVREKRPLGFVGRDMGIYFKRIPRRLRDRVLFYLKL